MIDISIGCAVITLVLASSVGGLLIPYTSKLGKPDYNVPLGLLQRVWFKRVRAIGLASPLHSSSTDVEYRCQ